jgi:hypothetical protein
MLSAEKSVNTPCNDIAESSIIPGQDVFIDGREFLENLSTFLLETAGLFRTGEDYRARDSFVQAVKGLEFFTFLVDRLCSICRINLKEISCSGKNGEEHLEYMNTMFLEMVASQEKQDWVLLADLMEYEVVPQLRAWRELIAAMECKRK